MNRPVRLITFIRRWGALGVFVAIAAVTAVVQYATVTSQTLISRLYYLPVLLTALLYGWRWGIGLAVLAGSALLCLPMDPPPRASDRYQDAVLLLGTGALTGYYTDRERRLKKHSQEVAAQLSTVYESLQVNFEGMKRAERLSAIGHLSAGLAHEIRNPLASIAGAASILRRTISNSDSKVLRCITIIEGECRRLNGLLTNFLNFARPPSPQFRSTNLNVLLTEVLELAEHAVNRRQIQFRTEISPGLTNIDCDPEQLRQVLLNLIINAVEASDEGTTVTLAAGVEDEAIAIRVIDQGSGVRAEDIDRLFDPFFTTKETGTGLGLPVAHQIIGQMGGNLAARRNPARGMTFSVLLPLTREIAG